MKKLPLHRRPYFARTILEIGGGHDPYAGITHAVDKYPDENLQRASDYVRPEGVVFRQGDLEAIPFQEKFDFLYLSHVFEHVKNPEQAVSEINRITKRGYLATPSPFFEQIACPTPFDPVGDFHFLYVWTSPASPAGTLHVIHKTAERVGEFCDCEAGKTGRFMHQMRWKHEYHLGPTMPRGSKETSLHFSTPISLVTHPDFPSACKAGVCAYQPYAKKLNTWARLSKIPGMGRFNTIDDLKKKHAQELLA